MDWPLIADGSAMFNEADPATLFVAANGKFVPVISVQVELLRE